MSADEIKSIVATAKARGWISFKPELVGRNATYQQIQRLKNRQRGLNAHGKPLRALKMDAYSVKQRERVAQRRAKLKAL